MGKKEAASSSGVVTSDSLKRGRLPVQGLALGVVVVLIGAGVGFYGYKYGHWWASAPVASNPNVAPPVPSPAQQLASAQTALQAATTVQAKSRAYSQLGSAYLAANKPKDAIAAYKQALPNTPDKFGTLSNLSGAYELSGQYDLAIKALQQMVSLLNTSTNSEDQALVVRIQNHITDLQRYAK